MKPDTSTKFAGSCDTSPSPDGLIACFYSPDPFLQRVDRSNAMPGASVAEIVKRLAPVERVHPLIQVHIGTDYIPQDMWHCVRLRPAAPFISVVVVPKKSKGKNPLATILSIAMLFAAPALGGVLAGQLGLGATQVFGVAASRILGGVIGFAGNMLINAIAPPPSPRSVTPSPADKPTLFIAGSQNQSLKFSAIPRILGKVRFTPPRAAEPYTEQRGQDSYVRILLTGGWGPLEISDLRLGTTSISEFEGVEVEIRKGYLDDAPVTLYSNQPRQTNYAATLARATETFTSDAVTITGSNTINLPAGHGLTFSLDDQVDMRGWSTSDNNGTFNIASFTTDSITTVEPLVNDAGGEDVTIDIAKWTTRTTLTNTDEISIDYTFNRGLLRFDKATAKHLDRTVEIETQYAPTGTTDWSNGYAFKAYIAQESPEMRRPSGRDSIQYVRVYLDPASGEILTIEGAVVKEPLTPVLPIVPPGMVPIASVIRRKSDGNDILIADITDDRSAEDIATYFETSGDFAPSASASNDKIAIAAGGLRHPGLIVTAKTTASLRKSMTFKVARGQYDVRQRRRTRDSEAETDADRIQDEVQLTAIRSIRKDPPVNLPGMCLIALCIKASDQLTGVIEQINCVAESILLDWDGEEWVEDTTSNPASLYREVLQGRANGRAIADSKVNLANLQYWHELNAVRGLEYGGSIDRTRSVGDVLDELAAYGRARKGIVDGKWGVVIDEVKTNVAGHFSPMNSRGLQVAISYPSLPHAFRVQFMNRDADWQADEVTVYDDGYSKEGEVPGTVAATKFEPLPLPGVTSADQAWKAGRYHIADARLRRRTITFQTDIENLDCTRGDLLKLNHDVMLAGLGYARVKQVLTSGSNVTGLVLNTPWTMIDGDNYAVRIRRKRGQTLYKTLQTVEGESTTVTFTTPFALDAGDGANSVDAGDLALFGHTGMESIDVVIKDIEYDKDLGATITVVDHKPAVHSADTGTIPDFESQISLPQTLQRPPQPVVANIQSGDEALSISQGGQFQANILLTLEPYSYPRNLTPGISLRGEDETDFKPARYSWENGLIKIEGVIAAEVYDIAIIWRAESGLSSAPTYINDYEVIGYTGRPTQVLDFSAQQAGVSVIFKWSEVAYFSVKGYHILYGPQGETISSATFLTEANRSTEMTNASVPPGDWTFYILAVDYADNVSSIATPYDLTVVNNNTIIQEQSYTLEFPIGVDGLIDGFYRYWTGELVPLSTSLASAGGWDTFDVFVPDAVAEARYRPEEVDTGADGQKRIWQVFTSVLGPGETEATDIATQIALSDTPGGGVMEDWIIGFASDRYFQSQLTEYNTGGISYITAFQVTVDAELRTTILNNVPVDAAGTVLDFADYDLVYHLVPNVEVSPAVSGATSGIAINVTMTDAELHLYNGGSGVTSTANVKIIGV